MKDTITHGLKVESKQHQLTGHRLASQYDTMHQQHKRLLSPYLTLSMTLEP